MSERIIDVEPDSGQILQEEDYAPVTVPVCVQEPVQTRELPTKSGGFRSFVLVAGAAAVKVLSRDPRRRRALLIAYSTTGIADHVHLSTTQAGGASEYTAHLPMQGSASSAVSPVLELTCLDEIWATTNTQSVTLTVINEQWA